MTRVVLVSGKGGVGKTTVAAATAVGAARRGHRVLAMSLDRAHNLGDVLGAALGAEPAPVAHVPGLEALEADPQAEMRRHWEALRGYFARLFEWAGLGGAEADEMAVFPGLEELLVLSRLCALVEQGTWELLVVDLAPTASSLRVLSFPELMAGPIGRLVKLERSVLGVARPVLARVLSAPLPEEATYAAMDAIAARLARLRAVLTDPARTVVRLVAIPERVVVDETRAAFSLLSFFGLCVDAVVFNRVLPPEVERGYLGAWTRIQAREMARGGELFGDTPLRTLRFAPAEVHGPDALEACARELYGRHDPAAPFAATPPVRVRDEAGARVLEVRVGPVDGRALDLKQRDDELILTLGAWRRQFALPAALRGRSVTGAAFEAGTLRVQFGERGGGADDDVGDAGAGRQDLREPRRDARAVRDRPRVRRR